MNYEVIRDVNFKNKTVLVRVDYNVPIEDGKIVSDFRIRASLPTLECLREKGAKRIILLSHLGRPEGKDKQLSLKKVADRLSKLISDVTFVDDVSGPDVEAAVKKMKKGGILLLENLRFYPGEEKNSSEFIREIIDSVEADLYVQDGFAVVHRAHASVSAVADHLPVYAGLLLEKEIESLSKAIKSPEKPLVAIIGGSKVEDKEPLIKLFAKKATQVVVGGKIAADGYISDQSNVYVSEDFDEDSEGHKLDMGPLATVKLADAIKNAKTIIWNGLLGKAEDPAYATASTVAAELIGEKPGATTIICGGDTTGFVEEIMSEHENLNYTLLSTGGGAALEFLLGKKLPGLEVLENK